MSRQQQQQQLVHHIPVPQYVAYEPPEIVLLGRPYSSQIFGYGGYGTGRRMCAGTNNQGKPCGNPAPADNDHCHHHPGGWW
jgi:hypothetical protein